MYNMKLVEHLKTRTEFKTFISQHSSSLMVVKFYADWCNPCKKIKDDVVTLFENVEHSNKILICVNYDTGSDIRSYFRIKQVPTLMSIQDGNPDKVLVSSDILEISKFFSSL